MSEPTAEPSRLAQRLRDLRASFGVTQRVVSQAMGTTPASVSSWESGGVVPPQDRIDQYATFFATRRSIASRPAALVTDLDADERARRDELVTELVGLRDEVAPGSEPAARRSVESGQLGGRFWYFPDDQRITILCTRMSLRQLVGPERAEELRTSGGVPDASYPPVAQYALNPLHPNRVRGFANGDVDALIDLVGHIRAENPVSEVRWKLHDEVQAGEELLGHVVLLGGADITAYAGQPDVTDLIGRLEVPVRGEWDNEDAEFGLWFEVYEDEQGHPTADPRRRVRSEEYYPEFRDADLSRAEAVAGVPELVHDLALIARRPNPFNQSATVTILQGLFSRGTHGAVLAFTRERGPRNERALQNLVADPDNFWLIARVPTLAGRRTIPPDLGQPRNVLRSQ